MSLGIASEYSHCKTSFLLPYPKEISANMAVRSRLKYISFFFSWCYNPHWGWYFYSPLTGFSLLACEVS